MQSVKLGRYKIAFWHPSNGIVIYSKMYDEFSRANYELDVLKRAGYITTMMEAKTVGDGNYTWEILPYGVGKYIPFLSKLYEHQFAIVVFALVFLTTRKLR